jgi:chromosome segregation ATPase
VRDQILESHQKGLSSLEQSIYSGEGNSSYLLKKAPSNTSSTNYYSPLLIESTYVKSSELVRSVVSNPQRESFRLEESEVEKQLEADSAKRIANLEEEYQQLREKMGSMEQEIRSLEKRNFELAQEMMASETTIRNHEKK